MPNISVLIVDDEKDFCFSFRDFLKMKGITADIALDGDAAKSKIESKTYDFIFFDFNMPGITGIDLPGIIKKNNPKAKRILVSGYDLVDEKFKNLLELDALIKKPVKLEALYEIIKGKKI
ncbi:MAG: response regulator [Candidatus Omnitrophota bacterium]